MQNDREPRKLLMPKSLTHMPTHVSDNEELNGDSSCSSTRGESPDILSRNVRDMVRTILCADHSKSVIRREDLCTRDLGHEFTNVLKEAKYILNDVFGYELVELPAQSSKGSLRGTRNSLLPTGLSARGKRVGSCILRSRLNPRALVSILGDSTAVSVGHSYLSTVGQLFILLSLIFMHGGTLREDELWNCLSTLNIYPQSRTSTMAEDRCASMPMSDRVCLEWMEEEGDMEKLLQRFLRQSYVVRCRQPLDVSSHRLEDGRGILGSSFVFEYRWGPRAFLEVKPNDLATFLASVMDMTVDPLLLSQIEQIFAHGTENVEEESVGVEQNPPMISEQPPERETENEDTHQEDSSFERRDLERSSRSLQRRGAKRNTVMEESDSQVENQEYTLTRSRARRTKKTSS